ncbi:MAG: SufE family protein, partial [Bacteroidota bacterium]
MTLAEIQEELIDEFALFDDWMDKYEHLIGLGKSLPLIDPSLKTEDRIIKGCQSKVWLDAKMAGDQVVFTADSDAIITKGIVAVLIRVFSKQTPEDIVAAKTDFIDA